MRPVTEPLLRETLKGNLSSVPSQGSSGSGATPLGSVTRGGSGGGNSSHGSSGSSATPLGSVTGGGSGGGNSTHGQRASLQPELFHSFLSALDTPGREEAMLGSGFDAEGRY